jgi:3-oxoacyl-[acyl-carrier protein] reductase
MSKNKFGRIVNISTVAVAMALEGESAYASSKAAIEAVTVILSKEYAPFNITCNTLGLAPMKTSMLEMFPEEKVNDVLSRQSIRRLGEFGDVINAVDFLVSGRSGFVTGQSIYLGGVTG